MSHGPITMRGCVKYIHDPDTTLNFDRKVKFIEFMTWFCVQASAFLFIDIVILRLALECITMVYVRSVTYIHELCMTLDFDLNITILFSLWIWVWQNVFALWHRHTKFLHMGVSSWDMLCTFLTLVWLWPLTYMWVAGGILSKFYSVFILFNLILQNMASYSGWDIWYPLPCT